MLSSTSCTWRATPSAASARCTCSRFPVSNGQMSVHRVRNGTIMTVFPRHDERSRSLARWSVSVIWLTDDGTLRCITVPSAVGAAGSELHAARNTDSAAQTSTTESAATDERPSTARLSSPHRGGASRSTSRVRPLRPVCLHALHAVGSDRGGVLHADGELEAVAHPEGQLAVAGVEHDGAAYAEQHLGQGVAVPSVFRAGPVPPRGRLEALGAQRRRGLLGRPRSARDGGGSGRADGGVG